MPKRPTATTCGRQLLLNCSDFAFYGKFIIEADFANSESKRNQARWNTSFAAKQAFPAGLSPGFSRIFSLGIAVLEERAAGALAVVFTELA